MSSPPVSLFDALRRPEYTGDNRCTPCTIVNVLVAGVVSAALWTLLWPWLAAVALAVSLGAIYFRGYLVPGTPTLTKRYFPDVVLRAFDKEPTLAATNGHGPQPNLERLLLDSGLVVECPDADDLCLDPAFRADWFERIQSVRTRENSRENLASLLDVDPERIEYFTFEDAFVMTVDERRVGRWESSAAFHADVAGAELLPDRFPAWDSLGPAQRASVLGSLRLFLDTCPDCGAPVTVSEDTVESCCREYEVVAVECSECGARLLEVDRPEIGD